MRESYVKFLVRELNEIKGYIYNDNINLAISKLHKLIIWLEDYQIYH